MTQWIEAPDYAAHMATYFDQRSVAYDRGDFHPLIADRLVEYAMLRPGARILDMATGTGMVAIAAAQRVGPTGQVIGVDLSAGMLAQARQKIAALGLANIQFIQANAETVTLDRAEFDWVFCSSALTYMHDIPGALRHWRSLLNPDGQIGLHGFAQTAFVAGRILTRLAQQYGVPLVFNQPTGTEEHCRDLLAAAGFQDIQIRTEQCGSYLSLEDVLAGWEANITNPLCRSLQQLSASELAAMRRSYIDELTALVTPKGIWNDITTFFVFARR